jgi:hypothetical protein
MGIDLAQEAVESSGTFAPERRPVVRADRYDFYPPGTIGIICDRLREGETLTRICRDPAMPSFATLSRWREADKTIADAIREARRASAEAHADRAIDAVDDATSETATADKLRADMRRWTAARYRPEVYGDRVAAEVSGPNGGPVQIDAAATLRGLELLLLERARKEGE